MIANRDKPHLMLKAFLGQENKTLELLFLLIFNLLGIFSLWDKVYDVLCSVCACVYMQHVLCACTHTGMCDGQRTTCRALVLSFQHVEFWD